jgi:hypothetical protein
MNSFLDIWIKEFEDKDAEMGKLIQGGVYFSPELDKLSEEICLIEKKIEGYLVGLDWMHKWMHEFISGETDKALKLFDKKDKGID